MGLFEQFPYTNFHEMNLDWLLQEWLKLSHDFTTISEAFTDLQTFVNNYFDNLDLQEEVNNKLNQMFAEGQLTDVLLQAISVYEGQFEQELNAMSSRIDAIAQLPAGSTSGDAELIDARIGWKGAVYSSAGAAIRGQVTEAERSLEYIAGRNEFDGYAMPSGVAYDVTFTWDNASKMVVSGTASGNVLYSIFSDNSAFPGDIIPGDICTLNYDTNNSNLIAEVFYYDGSNWTGIAYNITKTRQFVIPTAAQGLLIRIRIASGVNAGGIVNLALCRGARMSDLYSGAFPIIATNQVIFDEKELIEAALNKYKHVILLPGTHYSTGISMPANTTLEGCGECTVLHTASAEQNGVVISKPDCTVKNMAIVDSAGIGSVLGTTSGVYVLGDGGTTWLHNIRIENVTCTGFRRAGIDGEGLGYEPTNSLTIIGCRCVGNYVGLLLQSNCEYCRVADSIFTSNQYGCMNKSGNNKFTNCDFSSNISTGFFFDGSMAEAGNHGHGSCVGCTFNHNGNNTGFGILIRNNQNGFAFSGCQIWYNMAYQSDNSTAVFVGCLFGGNTSAHLSTWTGATAFVSSCIWYATPDIRGGAAANILSSCYQSDGTPVT